MTASTLYPVTVMVVLLVLSLSFSGNCSAGDNLRHHHVGDDRGWDPSSDVASWAAGRIFLVGDSLWFTYSAAQEKIVELSSKEEYEACDLSNPIKMYTDGLSKVTLDGEGVRYFASGNTESCKKGLKLPIEVKSQSTPRTEPLSRSEEVALADSPSSPSDSGRVRSEAALVLGALLGGIMIL